MEDARAAPFLKSAAGPHAESHDRAGRARQRLGEMGVSERQLHTLPLPGEPLAIGALGKMQEMLQRTNPLHLLGGSKGEVVRGAWSLGAGLGLVAPNPLSHIAAPIEAGVREHLAQKKAPALKAKAEEALAAAMAKNEAEPTFGAALALAGARAELDTHALREKYPKELMKHRVTSAFLRPHGTAATALTLPLATAPFLSSPLMHRVGQAADASVLSRTWAKHYPNAPTDELRGLRSDLGIPTPPPLY